VPAQVGRSGSIEHHCKVCKAAAEGISCAASASRHKLLGAAAAWHGCWSKWQELMWFTDDLMTVLPILDALLDGGRR
jgi:hypothetical protein